MPTGVCHQRRQYDGADSFAILQGESVQQFERWDEQHEGVEVVVDTGKDQFDILRIARSNAANYDMDTTDLIQRLEEYDRRYGIDIVRAATDLVAFRLIRMPDDISDFAVALYEFCPDIVDQGTGSVAALVEELGRDKTVYLWWD